MFFKMKPGSRIILLAPHTDDIELGAGGFVNKAINSGAEAFYFAFSDCQESVPHGFDPGVLKNECYEATGKLGIPGKNVQVQDYRVRHFSDHRQEILEDLIRVKRDVKPDLVITPSLKDMHQDHKVIAEESIRAFKNTTIISYQFDWNCLEISRNFFVDLSECDIQAKIDALSSYKSQQCKRYFEPEFVRSHAVVMGAQFGFDYAEGFELVRLVMANE